MNSLDMLNGLAHGLASAAAEDAQEFTYVKGAVDNWFYRHYKIFILDGKDSWFIERDGVRLGKQEGYNRYAAALVAALELIDPPKP